MKIAILDDYQDVVKDLDCFSLLNAYDVTILNETFKDINLLAEKLKDISILVLIRERTIINKELLEKLPKLKLICQTGRLSSNIDLKACEEFGIKVVDGIGSPIAPSELCWALIMNSSRHLYDYISNFQNNIWQNSSYKGLGKSLYGQTLGIWGYGKIGQRVASYAKVFGMNITIWGSEESRKKALEDGFGASHSKEEFFSSCDIISINLKLSDKSRYCVTKQDLELMKDGSIFVNISRADLVEHNALFEVYSTNKNKFAALDVFEDEPILPKNEPLLTLPNILATPHLGYVEKANYEIYFKVAFEKIIEYANSLYSSK
ncbi:D-2-hydroxyacid dehydrogenase family protein [Halarcobacter ebronensis]|uniref:3-phosphoglycerate dehydrogenase n=1 Tax=Halarcobacter ebronensis TaxID=1462615 RepID=A0A4Q1AJQ0_9BACT|nr:D-2-hydroxyacid dehydrogenase family protein [Halarcobacter ebronensis]QKF81722.1 phosphoglycerate dehydrogenase [Halarcobacter ebronensis]RXK04600.1 3-phosphoglycerate dehydrogenase [Halarcobacter ebronensis]